MKQIPCICGAVAAMLTFTAVGYVAALNLHVMSPSTAEKLVQASAATLTEVRALRADLATPKLPSEAPVAEIVAPPKKARPRRKAEGGAFGDFNMFGK